MNDTQDRLDEADDTGHHNAYRPDSDAPTSRRRTDWRSAYRDLAARFDEALAAMDRRLGRLEARALRDAAGQALRDEIGPVPKELTAACRADPSLETIVLKLTVKGRLCTFQVEPGVTDPDEAWEYLNSLHTDDVP